MLCFSEFPLAERKALKGGCELVRLSDEIDVCHGDSSSDFLQKRAMI